MMDLGATVCVPRRPLCGRCPLRTLCSAHLLGKEEAFPRKVRRRPVPHYDMAVAVVQRGRRILIDRRRNEGLLGGLWELPTVKVAAGETLAEAARRGAAEQLGIRIRVLEKRPMGIVHHAYSHFRVTLHVFRCRYLTGRCRAIGCEAFQWARPGELENHPFSAAHLKIIATLRRDGGIKCQRRRTVDEG